MIQISIGLPFFNAAETLSAAIASVFNQTFADWELILLDDGSTDAGRSIAAKALADPRVRLIADGKNRGLVHRLNQLAQLARGPVLARMDADDVMHPERLERQWEFLRRSGSDVVGTSAYVMDERQNVVGLRRSGSMGSRAEVLRKGGFIHPSCLGWRAWFLTHPYDEGFPRAEDLELWARTAGESRFASLDLPLLFYRESRAPNLRAYRTSWRTSRNILGRYGHGALGWSETQARKLRSHAAGLLYQLASPYPAVTGALLDRRNEPISRAERTRAESVLALAMQGQPQAGAP